MSNYQELLFIVFFIVAGMIILDANVGAYFLLKLAQVKLSFERLYWMIRIHPKNPITNYLAYRKYDKIAKELCEEYQSSTYISPEDRVDL